MKFRVTNTGYCGGASILLHFDESVHSGELKPNEMAVVYAVESSKWMSGGFLVRSILRQNSMRSRSPFI